MRSGRYVTQIRGYKAFEPAPLPPTPPIVISESMQELLTKANTLLAKLDGLSYTLPNMELFITMYIRKEALLSAQIEGSQASLEDVLQGEQGEPAEHVNDVADVINYIKALLYGMKRLDTLPMSLRLLKELHAIVISQKDKTPGEFKRSQNWIGGNHGSLESAVFVPPTPEESAKAMSDLEQYMHAKSSLPTLIDCALIHYQFETIHPFLDGNGRVGRLLIVLYLYWKKTIEKPLLYVSYYLKKNRREYFDRLMLVRTSGNYEQWVEFFLKGIVETSESAIEETKKILELRDRHQKLLFAQKTASLLAGQLLDHLFYTPVVTVQDVQEKLNVSFPAASALLNKLVELGILREVTGQKRAKRFVYHDYMNILTEGAQPLP